jgi:ribose transport system permease protein
MPETEVRPPTQSDDRGSTPPVAAARGRRAELAKALSFRNISAIYIFIVMFIIFSFWVPDTFLKWDTWKSLIDSQAVTAILAIGLVVTLSAGNFDLAIGTELGFGAIFVSWLMVEQGVSVPVAIALTLLAGAVIGACNALLVIKVKLDSFIATLGVSSILLAMIAWVSSSQQILGLPPGIENLGETEVLNFRLPVYIMLVVGVAVWYLLEHTSLGRRVFATGGNIDAARLAGVRVSALIFGTMVITGTIAAIAGILEAASLGAADPTIGPGYLLPAFSAAFLGSTQFRGGRFNVWGTVVAVFVLATGVKGLQLAGAPIWLPELFNGAALLIAVGMAKYERAPHRAGVIHRFLGLGRKGAKRLTPEAGG